MHNITILAHSLPAPSDYSGVNVLFMGWGEEECVVALWLPDGIIIKNCPMWLYGWLRISQLGISYPVTSVHRITCSFSHKLPVFVAHFQSKLECANKF
jgi:hypothetical protein